MSVGESCGNCGMEVVDRFETDGDVLLFHDEGDYSRSYCRFPDEADTPTKPRHIEGTFANRLYDAKQASGLTYRELAKELSVHRSAVESWVVGDYEASGENRERAEAWITEQLDDD